MTRPVLLIDLDETVFPFVDTWNRWLVSHGKQGVDYDALVWFYDVELYLPNHLDHQPRFVAALESLDPQPIPDAAYELARLADLFDVRVCTARNSSDWGAATRAWVEEHLPYVSRIVHTRDDRGDSATPKHEFARKMKAHALIDDTAAWMDDLPSFTHGMVVQRPAPLASDAGARPWHEIAAHLRSTLRQAG